jgi:hypothetical protein
MPTLLMISSFQNGILLTDRPVVKHLFLLLSSVAETDSKKKMVVLRMVFRGAASSYAPIRHKDIAESTLTGTFSPDRLLAGFR